MKNLGENGNNKNEFRLTSDLKENPFTIPEDYFSTLQNEIILNSKIIKLTDSTFSIPSDYQTKLTNDILARISEEKLIAKNLTDGFSVPEGYFIKLEEDTLSKVASQKPKIIPISKSRITWMSYVAAACFVIAVSIIIFFSKTNSNDNLVVEETIGIDALPTEDIINYLAFYSETGDLIPLSDQLSEKFVNLTDSFSSDEIELYLENSI